MNMNMTEEMIGREKPYIIVCEDEKGFFGVEYVNHPTPSGSERHLPTYSDSRRWQDKETAKTKMQEALNALRSEE